MELLSKQENERIIKMFTFFRSEHEKVQVVNSLVPSRVAQQ